MNKSNKRTVGKWIVNRKFYFLYWLYFRISQGYNILKIGLVNKSAPNEALAISTSARIDERRSD